MEINLGVRFDSKRNKTSGVYEQVPVNDTFIYVPLLKTLDFIFKNEEVCCQMNKSAALGNIYQDFCDGKYYKHHPLFSKSTNSLQIQVYYDEKLQTLSGQNVVFISLDAYILHSAIYHHV